MYQSGKLLSASNRKPTQQLPYFPHTLRSWEVGSIGIDSPTQMELLKTQANLTFRSFHHLHCIVASLLILLFNMVASLLKDGCCGSSHHTTFKVRRKRWPQEVFPQCVLAHVHTSELGHRLTQDRDCLL